MRGTYDLLLWDCFLYSSPHLIPLIISSLPFIVLSFFPFAPSRSCTCLLSLVLSHCIQQILESVHHCHVNGIVHRDLKVCKITATPAVMFTCDTVKQMATFRKTHWIPWIYNAHFTILHFLVNKTEIDCFPMWKKKPSSRLFLSYLRIAEIIRPGSTMCFPVLWHEYFLEYIFCQCEEEAYCFIMAMQRDC